MNIRKVRGEIPLLRVATWLDHAHFGPQPFCVAREMTDFIQRRAYHGVPAEEWILEIAETKKLFAELIGAEFDEIACVPNVTSGLMSIASGLKYKKDGNVVLADLNFLGNLYVWHIQRKVGHVKDVRILRNKEGKIPIDEYEKAIDDKTTIVPIDYVSWVNGYREKVKEIAQIAHSHNAIILVDAFQAAGAVPIDVKKEDIDVLTTGTYKWLNGPYGFAFLYVKDEIIREIEPRVTGWMAMKDNVVSRIMKLKGSQDFEFFDREFNIEDAVLSNTATKFEGGTPAIVNMYGAKVALTFALQNDSSTKFQRILKLTQRIIEGLQAIGIEVVTPLEPESRSGIVVYKAQNPTQSLKKLRKLNIFVDRKPQAIRVSPHFYNTEEEVDRFLEVVVRN